MNLSTRVFREHPLGHVFEDSNVTVFFGDARSTNASVRSAFPDFDLLGLRQTHSDIVVVSPSDQPDIEADGHYTQKRKLALSIRTADCIPVMIQEPESGTIIAIHAGWRGIENEIIRKAAAEMAKNEIDLRRAHAWIGPHIGKESFEVGHDVALKLDARLDAVRGYADDSTAILAHPNPQKAYVDLFLIARAQLRSIGIGQDRTIELPHDTFKTPAYESFRRDRDKAGRQISFIALK